VKITLSGKDGADVKRYQDKKLKMPLKKSGEEKMKKLKYRILI
jgi:hypothetical protein